MSIHHDAALFSVCSDVHSGVAGPHLSILKKKENYKNNVYNMINVDIFSFGMY